MVFFSLLVRVLCCGGLCAADALFPFGEDVVDEALFFGEGHGAGLDVDVCGLWWLVVVDLFLVGGVVRIRGGGGGVYCFDGWAWWVCRFVSMDALIWTSRWLRDIMIWPS